MALLALGLAAIEAVNVARAYVGGESLYAQAQKDAVISLHRYVSSGDPADFDDFTAAMQKPLGDFEVRGRLLCCQTFIEGSSLARKLRAARFSEAEIRPWVEELLDILEHVHGRRIVHRDVKPDNVIIDPAGRAHLVDFGAARAMDAVEQEVEPTVAGTPGFMPPEQMRGEIRPQSDLFGVGKLALGQRGLTIAQDGLEPLLRERWLEQLARGTQQLAELRAGRAGLAQLNHQHLGQASRVSAGARDTLLHRGQRGEQLRRHRHAAQRPPRFGRSVVGSGRNLGPVAPVSYPSARRRTILLAEHDKAPLSVAAARQHHLTGGQRDVRMIGSRVGQKPGPGFGAPLAL